MSGRAIAKSVVSSDQRGASGDQQLFPIKFMRPTEIITGLVADALDKGAPVGELIDLQQVRWLAYPKAQQWLMDDLWSKEREEFDRLLDTDECSDRLRACMDHRGELFRKFAHSGDSEALTSDVVLNQRIAWADLMTEELEYLGRQPRWHDYHLTMAIHACGVMTKLLEAWTFSANGAVPPHLWPRLLDATRAIVQGVPFKRLISAEVSLEGVAVFSEAIMLAAALDDIELAEEVVELLPIVFKMCQSNFPTDFCNILLADSDVDDECSNGEFDDDEFHGDGDVSEGYTDASWRESADDTNESLSCEGYEIFDEDELACDMSFNFKQVLEAETEALREVLIPALGLCLRELRRVPARESRIEYLQNIVVSSPIGMVLWQEVVDTLISVSPSGFNDILPLLLQRCINDLSGGDCILGIADYSFRMDLEWHDGPLLALAKELKAMKESDRIELLQRASEFLDEGPELFLDFNATQAGFARLCKELGVRRLIRGR